MDQWYTLTGLVLRVDLKILVEGLFLSFGDH